MAYHICIRILFPSTMIVFILKSIPKNTERSIILLYGEWQVFQKQPADINNDFKAERFPN